MATTTVTGNFISVTGIAADWDWKTSATGYTDSDHLRVKRIIFKPGNADDVISIKEKTDAGAYIAYGKADSGDPLVFEVNDQCRPVVDFSECTLNTGHAVIIHVW